MGDYNDNDAAVRGSACEFTAAGHTKTRNAAEGWVLTSGDGRSSSTGSGDTVAQVICGQVSGNSGGVGGYPAYFDVSAIDTGYEGGGRLRVPWWRKEAVENHLRVTVEAILSAV